jgi:xylitol oxidase
MSDTNWAGNYTYRAGILHRPSTVEQVRELVADAFRMRVLGSRHSFTDIADSSALLSLDGLPADVVVDHAAGTVSCSGGLRYGELAEALAVEGVALANLASLPTSRSPGPWPPPPTARATPTATWPPRSPAWSWSPPRAGP